MVARGDRLRERGLCPKLLFIYLGKSVKNKILIYNDGLHQPNLDDAGTIVRRALGLPITAGCDTAWNRNRVCSDASSSDRYATQDPTEVSVSCSKIIYQM